MALEDCVALMDRCSQCSYCQWIPLDQIKSWRFAKGCPSLAYKNFMSYSARGRYRVALSLLRAESEYTDTVLDIVYTCLACGSCDVACKISRYNMEPLETMRELKFRLVEDGQVLPQHMLLIDGLRKEDNMMLACKADRGKWAQGLNVKLATEEQAEVLFHAGCRLSYDGEQQKIARTAVSLLKQAGIDIAIMGNDELCCGGRAYDMGYKGEFTKFAQSNIEAWATARAKTIVTSCSDCYFAIKRLYPAIGSGFEVLHTTEFIDRLISEGKIKFTKSVPLTVTYHDPCHLGRLGEPYVPWSGVETKIRNQIIVYKPRKPRYNGIHGVYDPPRNVLKSIPGIELVEMERIREYAWCCGAGGGARELYPDYANWTASERIEEAKSTGAEAIVSACGWCERNFKDAIDNIGARIKVFDIVELVQQALQRT